MSRGRCACAVRAWRPWSERLRCACPGRNARSRARRRQWRPMWRRSEMPSTVIKGDRVPIRLWAAPGEVEPEALQQLRAVSSLPWVAHHVAVMPDVHVGKGATVGSVIALRGAVAPAAVGVDIGCGMAAVKTNVTADELPDNLKRVRLGIEAVVPVGRGLHKSAVWEDCSPELTSRGQALFARFSELTPVVHRLADRAGCQLGTLG